jgi:hypothetical protein
MRTWTDREIAGVGAMIAQRVPLADIRRQMWCTVGQLYRLRRRKGWLLRVRDKAGRREGVRRLSRDGRPDGEVARLLGCGRATVARHRKELGIPAQRTRGGRQPPKASQSDPEE